MATSPLFGWEEPDDTDLVKDGAAAIRTLGNAIDTSMGDLLGGTSGQILAKNSNTNMDFTWITNDVGDITAVTAGTGISGGGTSGAVTITNDMATTITAAGDIVLGTGSGTYDNLPIGTTGQILTADTTVSPYKVKWATAAASGMTLIKQAAFSNVANTGTTFDSMFSSTYLSYLVTIDTIYAATSLDNLECQLLYSGSTQATGYYGSALQSPTTGSTVLITGTSNGTSLTLSSSTGASGGLGNGYFFISNCAPANALPNIIGMFNETNAVGQPGFFGGAPSTNQVYTGFRLKSSSSNITGTVSVYGLAK